MSESFADLFNESLKRSEMRTGEVITAEVVRIEIGRAACRERVLMSV